MANVEINELTELTSPDGDDLLIIDDESGGAYTTKNIKYSNLVPYQYMYIRVLGESDALSVGDGKMTFVVPFNCVLKDAEASVTTGSAADGPIAIQLRNLDYSGGAQDMLTTKITIDDGELSSYTAAAPCAPNASYDDIAAGDRIRIDVDDEGDGDAEGLDVILVLQRTMS